MHEHRRDQRAEAACAILVTSDVRTHETDETGRIAIQILEDEGHKIAFYKIVSNDRVLIREAVEGFLTDDGVEVIITSGGTGISPKDKTVDSVAPLFEKRLEGFGEMFRRLSYEEVGHSALISRATAGTVGNKIIFCLPGSKGAVEMGLRKIIIPEIGHMLWELNRT
jgi:molybdenum cofactor biosynthesis protein B